MRQRSCPHPQGPLRAPSCPPRTLHPPWPSPCHSSHKRQTCPPHTAFTPQAALPLRKLWSPLISRSHSEPPLRPSLSISDSGRTSLASSARLGPSSSFNTNPHQQREGRAGVGGCYGAGPEQALRYLGEWRPATLGAYKVREAYGSCSHFAQQPSEVWALDLLFTIYSPIIYYLFTYYSTN